MDSNNYKGIYKPDLTFVMDEAPLPINEEHRKKMLKAWKDAMPKSVGKFGSCVIFGTGGEVK